MAQARSRGVYQGVGRRRIPDNAGEGTKCRKRGDIRKTSSQYTHDVCQQRDVKMKKREAGRSMVTSRAQGGLQEKTIGSWALTGNCVHLHPI